MRLFFLAGKSQPTLLRGWLRDTGCRICYDLPLFATICHYSPLFETIRTIRHSLFGTLRCSLFVTIRYSLFRFSRHPNWKRREYLCLAWYCSLRKQYHRTSVNMPRSCWGNLVSVLILNAVGSQFQKIKYEFRPLKIIICQCVLNC